MPWDDYYGAQANPYDADDFKIILDALKALPDQDNAELQVLIATTQKALITEAKSEGIGWCNQCEGEFITANGVTNHLTGGDGNIDHDKDANHVAYGEA